MPIFNIYPTYSEEERAEMKRLLHDVFTNPWVISAVAMTIASVVTVCSVIVILSARSQRNDIIEVMKYQQEQTISRLDYQRVEIQRLADETTRLTRENRQSMVDRAHLNEEVKAVKKEIKEVVPSSKDPK